MFSVTAQDCDWQYTVGSGPGGQNRNKVATAVRCTHRASGATGRAEDSRSQLTNRRAAFKRMAASETFQKWLRLEAARRTGALDQIEADVKRAMSPANLLVEGKDERGRWSSDAIEPDENAGR